MNSVTLELKYKSKKLKGLKKMKIEIIKEEGKMKKIIGMMIGLLLIAGITKTAWAINPDQITISITPVSDINVTISSDTVEWNNAGQTLSMTNVTMGTTDYFIKPATVTYTGSFIDTEINLQGVDTMATWTFDADETAENDELQVYVLFSENNEPTAPSPITLYENTKNLVTTGLARIGENDAENTDGNYLNTAYDTVDEDFDPGVGKHMWIRLDMPPYTSDVNAQVFSITLTAVDDD